MATEKTGWEREHRTHFDEIVVNYDRIRPEYPRALIDDMIRYAGAGAGKKALEIGAGTGKATAPILGAGCDVTAVEIGANMAAFLRERFRGNERLNVLVAAFEEAPLDENSYDLIYAASAFHWVNAEIGCPKLFRLLKGGGAAALLRYNIAGAENAELENDIQAAYEKYYYTYYTEKHPPEGMKVSHESRESYGSPDGIRRGYGFSDLADYGFTDITMNLYDVKRAYGADEYIVWLDTMNDHRYLPDANRTALYAGVKAAIQNHGGRYVRDFVFQLYMGRKPRA